MAASLKPGAPVFVGASGGGDSTALLAMLADVAAAQGRALIAGIVDHAWREGSDADVARAAEIATQLGAQAHVVRLTWPAETTRSQARARTARYAALARIARTVGADTLFVGHTWDDQAETLLIRADAGSGARGMAGMSALSPCPIWPEAFDLQLARPLLGWRRAELRDVLRAEAVPWLEDPANALPRYARTRARAQLATGEAGTAFVNAAKSSTNDAIALDAAALAFLAAHGRLSGDTAVVTHVDATPGGVRALQALATAIGGAARETSEAAAARLAAALAAGRDGTLAGARFRAGPAIRVSRDPGGVLGRRGGGVRLADLALPVGEKVVWDGRLALTASEPGWRVTLAGAGPQLRRGETVCLPEQGPVTARWLPAERVARLLWRGGTARQGA